MSSSHFCEANCAVQTTSEEKMSHSLDLASWRWMNWLRCSSADSGNSRSFIRSPCDANWALNLFIAACWLPDVSLPRQNVTLPFAPLASASVGAFCTPLVAPVLFCPLAAPLPLPLELLLSSPPQAATTRAADAISAAARPLRTTMGVPSSRDPFRERAMWGPVFPRALRGEQ